MRWQFGMVVLSIVTIGVISGCAHNKGEYSDFVPFAPSAMSVDGPIDWPEVWEDEDFRIGLPILLTEFGHPFVFTGRRILVPRYLELDQAGIERALAEGVDPDYEEMGYRANLTNKAFEAGKQYRRGEARRPCTPLA